MKTLYIVLVFFALLSANYAISANISGIVKNSEGEPLPRANVLVLSTNTGVLTNTDGKFIINNIKPGNVFLSVSYLGYKTSTKEILVADGDNNVVEFVMTQVSVNINEVVVTANKREENIQVVPISISAITSDYIEDLNIRERSDLMGITPNTFIAQSGSHLTDLINIRGVFPSNFFTSTSLFFYEGVPIQGYGQNPMYLNDIERIEVLRGPQGTIYGRNSLAGVINIVSKKPSNKNSYQIGLNYGSYNDMNINFGTTNSLIDGKLFSRISGYYYSNDGYFKNSFLKTDVGNSKGYGGSLSLRYFPDETFSAELFGNLEYIDESIWCMAVNPDSALNNPYVISRNFDSYVKKYNYIGSLKLSYYLDFMKIISTTAYQAIRGMDWKYDADFTEYDILGFEERSPDNAFSEELRFESRNENSNIKWIAGLFYLNASGDNDYNAVLSGYKTQINQSIAPYGMEITRLDQYTKGTSNLSSIAAFGNVTLTFLDNFDFTIGYRYENETNKVDNLTFFKYTGTLPNPVPDPLKPALGFLNMTDTNKKEMKSDFLSHKYSLAYRLNKDEMAFINVSSGFHGGGFNSGSNKTHPDYGNENTWNYELGYKGTFLDNRLRINSSIFFIDWQNQQLLIIGDLSSPLQTISNAGKTEIKGLEFEATAILFEGLSMNFVFGYLDAKLKEYKFTDQINGKDSVFDFSGNKLPFTPDINSSLSVKYEIPADFAGLDGVFDINFNMQYMGKYYSSHMNLYETESRVIMNGKIGYNTQNYDVFFWVRNLTDLKYIYATYEYRGGNNALMGAPRTLGLTVNFKL